MRSAPKTFTCMGSSQRSSIGCRSGAPCVVSTRKGREAGSASCHLGEKMMDVEIRNESVLQGTEIQMLMCCSVEKMVYEGEYKVRGEFWCHMSVALLQSSCLSSKIPPTVIKILASLLYLCQQVLQGSKNFVLNPALTASELILCSVPIAFFS